MSLINHPRLGVNIDHVTTLRQARGEDYPCIKRALKQCLENGADQITIHLREDRRHIQDADCPIVRKITKDFNKLFNLELATAKDVIETAIHCSPDWVCIVPEKREEKTTEGGLNLQDNSVFEKISKTVDTLRSKIEGVKVSLFLEANLQTIEIASKLKPEAIEIHTGEFAKSYLKNPDKIESYLNDFLDVHKFLFENKIHCHAGHGLTREMLPQLIDLNIFEEYNIGHWIISESIFRGLGPVVKDLSEIIKK